MVISEKRTLIGTRQLTDSEEKEFEMRYYKTEKAKEEIIYGLEIEKYESINQPSSFAEVFAVYITESADQIDYILDKLIGNSVTVVNAPEAIDELLVKEHGY